MKRQHDLRRLLRWYPPSWRARYGDEFVTLLEDRLGGTPATMRLRLSVAYAGVRERSYGSGFIGARSSASAQRRTGSLIVLVGWAAMMIGGAGLAKTAEHFSPALPVKSRFVARFAYDMTAVAGVTGTLLVLAGAAVALPAFIRFLGANNWSRVRGAIERALIAIGVLIVATAGLAFWAHHLNDAQRNGANHLYSVSFLAFVLLVVVTLGLLTWAGVGAATKIDLSPRVLHLEQYFAYGVTLASSVAFGGATIWWIQISRHAPWFFNAARAGVATSPWSLNMVLTAIVMALGTATALWGSSRVALTYRASR